MWEEQHDGVYPVRLKRFYAHVTHKGEEVGEEAHDLPVDPVHQMIQHRFWVMSRRILVTSVVSKAASFAAFSTNVLFWIALFS